MKEFADQLPRLAHFTSVAELGSFTAAAKSFGISTVAMSKSIRVLETYLQVRLFHRSTRAVALTSHGQALFAQVKEPLEAMRTSTQAVSAQSARVRGLVRITCLRPFGAHYAIPALKSFLELQPEVEVELMLEDQVQDLVMDRYDFGIRVGVTKPSDVIARDIASVPFVICATPAYLDIHGTPASIDDLAQHNCLGLSVRDSKAGQRRNWMLRNESGVQTIAIKGSFIGSDFQALEHAALLGIGLFQAPLPLVIPHFRSGRLRPLVHLGFNAAPTVYVYYRSRSQMPLRTKLLMDHLLSELKVHPDLSTPPRKLCEPFA
jgi:DNA-binding transcriptional LysR family regulator